MFLDIDDTVKATYGARRQGARVGYTKTKSLNAQLMVASTATTAPVITATRRAGASTQILVRDDSGYYQQANTGSDHQGRVPERNTTKLAAAEQLGLFQVWHYRAQLTDNPAPLVTAEKTHRAHAIVEAVIADLKASALAVLPCTSHSANGAWLVAAAIAFNFTLAVGITAGGKFTKAETATIRA